MESRKFLHGSGASVMAPDRAGAEVLTRAAIHDRGEVNVPLTDVMLRAMSNAVMIVGPEGDVVALKPSARQMFALDPDLDGLANLREMLEARPDLDPVCDAIIAAVRDRDNIHEREVTADIGDVDRTLLIRATQLDGCHSSYALVVATDLTDRVMAMRIRTLASLMIMVLIAMMLTNALISAVLIQVFGLSPCSALFAWIMLLALAAPLYLIVRASGLSRTEMGFTGPAPAGPFLKQVCSSACS